MSQVSHLSLRSMSPLNPCYLVSWEFAPCEEQRAFNPWGVLHMGCSESALSKLDLGQAGVLLSLPACRRTFRRKARAQVQLLASGMGTISLEP